MIVTATRGAIDPRKNGRPFREVSATEVLIMAHTGQLLEPLRMNLILDIQKHLVLIQLLIY